MQRAAPILTVVLIFLASCTVAMGGFSSAPILGQVLSSDLRMDGVSVPSGTTLFDQTRLETGESLAAIHLSTGTVLEMAQNSRVYFEEMAPGRVRVLVEAGSLSYREGGEVVTLSSESETTLPQPPTSGRIGGAKTVLAEDALPGTLTLSVDDLSDIDLSEPIRIRSRDGRIEETASIVSAQGTTLTLRTGLLHAFKAQDLLFQDDAAVPAGPPGLDRGVLVALLTGAGAATTAILVVENNDDDRPPSPIRP